MVVSKYSCTLVILFTLVTLFIQFTLSSIVGKLLPQVYILKGAQLGKKNSKTITMSRTPNSTSNNGNRPAFPYHAYIGDNLPQSIWMNVAAPQYGSHSMVPIIPITGLTIVLKDELEPPKSWSGKCPCNTPVLVLGELPWQPQLEVLMLPFECFVKIESFV